MSIEAISKSDRNHFLRNLAFKSPAGMSEGVAADGGDAIGIDIAQSVVDALWADTTGILGKVSRYEVRQGANQIKIPAFAEPLMSAPATGTRAFWQDEAQLVTAVGGSSPSASKFSLSVLSPTLKTIVVLVPVTQELVEDVSNLDDLFTDRATKAGKRLMESEMMFGSSALAGVGYGGSDTNTTLSTTITPAAPTQAQLQAAFNLLHPALVQGAEWYVDKITYSYLFASGYNIVDKTFGKLTCLGLPVAISPYMTSASSAKTGLMLGNFAAYGMAVKPPKVMKSAQINIGYSSNQLYYRMTLRVAGGAQVNSITCTDGVTRSAFVVPA